MLIVRRPLNDRDLRSHWLIVICNGLCACVCVGEVKCVCVSECTVQVIAIFASAKIADRMQHTHAARLGSAQVYSNVCGSMCVHRNASTYERHIRCAHAHTHTNTHTALTETQRPATSGSTWTLHNSCARKCAECVARPYSPADTLHTHFTHTHLPLHSRTALHCVCVCACTRIVFWYRCRCVRNKVIHR